MARSRNIKPGFFLNDELAEIEPIGRLLFAGLWTIADKAGRLKDSPKKIKACVLPYDDCNVDKLLNELQQKKFIVRYEVDGELYIAILNWKKHQNPHMKEPPSEIPEPSNNEDCSLALNEHHTSTIQEQVLHKSSRADSLNLIPDSLNLIPDSLNLDSGASTVRAIAQFKPPEIEEVKEYCLKRNNNVDANKWHDFYSSKGWMVGKNKMKDWEAAVRTWEHKGRQESSVSRKNQNRPKSFDAIDEWDKKTEGLI